MSDLHKELLDSLKELPISENYSLKDRYADFRQLFTGSDQGKRVYVELLAWGRLFNTKIPGDSDNMYKIGIAEGHRNFVTKLMAAVNIEPKERPNEATRKQPINRSTKGER